MVIGEDTGASHGIESVFEVLWESIWLAKEELDEFFMDSWLGLLALLEHTLGSIETNDLLESVLGEILTD